MSDIEKELVKATGLKAKSGEKREKFLHRLIVATNKLPDSDWEDLSEDAQKWVNAGAKAVDEGSAKDIADFDEAEEAEEEEEVEEEEAEEEEEVEEEEEEEEEEPAPKKKKGKAKGKEKASESKANGKAKGKAKRAKDEEEEEEEEEEEPAPKKKGKGKDTEKKGKGSKEKDAPKKKAGRPVNDGPISGVKVELKKLLIKNPKMPVDDLQEKLEKAGVTVSRLTVSAIRAEFRHSLKVLKQEGILDLDA